MDNFGDDLNRFFDSFSLPTLKQVLAVPTNMPIGKVSSKEIEETFLISHRDMNNLIREIKEGDYFQAAQIGIVDALKIASEFGVPGTGVAATIVPYIFDFIDVQVSGRGRISVPLFIENLQHSQTKMSLVMKNLHEGKFAQATKLSLLELANAAKLAGGGPYATIAKITIVVGFGITQNGTIQNFFSDLIEFLASIGQTLETIGPAIDSGVFQLTGPPPVKKYPDGTIDTWSPTRGWVRTRRFITREVKK